MTKVAVALSGGIDSAVTASLLLEQGYEVVGLDWKESTIVHSNYKHYVCDVGNKEELPNIKNISYICNNAGIVTPKADAIRVNQIGYINVIETYGYDPCLKGILNFHVF